MENQSNVYPPRNPTSGENSLPGANQGLPSLQTLTHNEEPKLLSNIIKEQKEKNGKTDPESVKLAVKDKTKEFQIPVKWEWLPCNYELKREEKSIETHWSLSPTIQLIGNDQKNPPIMDISINLERSFMHNDELGWNWHKSWNLPNITISIKINDAITGDPILPPADLKAQLFAIKVLLNKSEQFKLYDLGLKGSTVQDLSEGQCTFSAIKFSSTSYNNDGVKFHLITLIYIQDDTRSRACPRILYSRISPPIFVDSRKSARDSNVTRNKKVVCKYFEPFPPDTFEKQFIKRNTKLNESKEELIENSLGGLSQYFTAPNIRNKVKHPIFLAAKFSNCVRLYYNTNLMKLPPVQSENREEEIVVMMQKVLMDSNVKEKGEAVGSNKAFDHKFFILLIEEPSNLDSFQLNKKISDYLDPIINEVLHIIFNSNIVPPHFQEVPSKDLVTAYSQAYNKLVAMRESLPSPPSSPEDEPPQPAPKKKGGKEAKEPRKVSTRKRGKASSDDEDDDDSETNESVAMPPVAQKKLKSTQEMITHEATPSSVASASSGGIKAQKPVPQQLAKPQVKPDIQTQKLMQNQALQQKPQGMGQTKVESEHFEVKNEAADGLSDAKSLAKFKNMLNPGAGQGVNPVGIDNPAFMKNMMGNMNAGKASVGGIPNMPNMPSMANIGNLQGNLPNNMQQMNPALLQALKQQELQQQQQNQQAQLQQQQQQKQQQMQSQAQLQQQQQKQNYNDALKAAGQLGGIQGLNQGLLPQGLTQQLSQGGLGQSLGNQGLTQGLGQGLGQKLNQQQVQGGGDNFDLLMKMQQEQLNNQMMMNMLKGMPGGAQNPNLMGGMGNVGNLGNMAGLGGLGANKGFGLNAQQGLGQQLGGLGQQLGGQQFGAGQLGDMGGNLSGQLQQLQQQLQLQQQQQQQQQQQNYLQQLAQAQQGNFPMQDFGRGQQGLGGNDFGNNPMIAQLLMAQQQQQQQPQNLNNFMMGGGAGGLNPAALQGGFGGLQGNSQADLLRNLGLNAGGQQNLQNMLGKLGGLGNLPK